MSLQLIFLTHFFFQPTFHYIINSVKINFITIETHLILKSKLTVLRNIHTYKNQFEAYKTILSYDVKSNKIKKKKKPNKIACLQETRPSKNPN